VVQLTSFVFCLTSKLRLVYSLLDVDTICDIWRTYRIQTLIAINYAILPEIVDEQQKYRIFNFLGSGSAYSQDIANFVSLSANGDNESLTKRKRIQHLILPSANEV